MASRTLRTATAICVVALVVTACGTTPIASRSRPSGTGSPSTMPARPTATASALPSETAEPSPSPARPPRVERAACGTGGRLVRFRVAVDPGLDTTPREFAGHLRAILCDERSWIASGRVRFAYDPSGPLLIGLRTPDEAEDRCLRITGGLSVRRFYSCASPTEIALNSDRWFTGSPYWPGPVRLYRRMLTNHEAGHAIGLRHRTCARDGDPAPVMMQQSKGLRSPEGIRCTRTHWPLPDELALVR